MLTTRRLIQTTATTLVAVLLASCAAGTSPEPTEPPPTSAPVAEQPSHDLADGEIFAWVMGLTGDGFVIDPAALLSGEEARLAAVEDGVIESGEDLPNDVYIRNGDESTSVVMATDGADFTLLLFDGQGSPAETSVSYQELVDALMVGSPDVYGVVDGVLPAMVTLEDGVITRISQVYLP
jgi:hypothetical protein